MEGSICVRLASMQLEMERSFRHHQHGVELRQQEHADRLAAKARLLLGSRSKHITVQQMNAIYDQVRIHA